MTVDPMDARRLVRDVARKLGVDPALVLCRAVRRDRDVERARGITALVLRRMGYSYRTIARALGSRDTGNVYRAAQRADPAAAETILAQMACTTAPPTG